MKWEFLTFQYLLIGIVLLIAYALTPNLIVQILIAGIFIFPIISPLCSRIRYRRKHPWKLYPTEALKGADFSSENAERLANDALFLHSHGRFQTAYSLSLLAWEETNKGGLLLKAYSEAKEISESKWNGDFLDHTFKFMAYPRYATLIFGSQGSAPQPGNNLRRTAKLFDIKKQLFGFYVDWHPISRTWSSPSRLPNARIDLEVNPMANYFASTSLLIANQICNQVNLEMAKSKQP